MTTGAVSRAKLQSDHHHQQTNIQFFYRPDALPVTQPTVSKPCREKYHIPWTCLPQAHLGVLPTLSLTTNSSHLGEVAVPLISPLMSVPYTGEATLRHNYSMLHTHARDMAFCLHSLVVVPLRIWFKRRYATAPFGRSVGTKRSVGWSIIITTVKCYWVSSVIILQLCRRFFLVKHCKS